MKFNFYFFFFLYFIRRLEIFIVWLKKIKIFEVRFNTVRFTYSEAYLTSFTVSSGDIKKKL